MGFAMQYSGGMPGQYSSVPGGPGMMPYKAAEMRPGQNMGYGGMGGYGGGYGNPMMRRYGPPMVPQYAQQQMQPWENEEEEEEE